MKKVIVFFIFSITSYISANNQLSDSAYISLLTCEPSTEIYARFWHTAIRVVDEKNDIDYAYNYGIFDFETDYFILKFISGKTDYTLERFYTEDLVDSYNERKSSIIEQKLNLDKNECQELFDALEENYMPQNRIYRYNFVYDNCATRAYNMIKKVIEQNGKTIYVDSEYTPTTYRTIFEQFLGKDNWQKFGIDFLISSQADREIQRGAIIAFPYYLMKEINATYMIKEEEKKIDTGISYLTKFPLQLPSNTYPFRPSIICFCLLIMVLILSTVSFIKQKYFVWIDVMLFSIFGVIGTIIFYLMFFSEHPLVAQNYNILWLNPLMLMFAIFIIIRRWRRWLSYIALFNAFTTIVAIIIFMAKIQVINGAFVSLIMIILIRSILFVLYFMSDFIKIKDQEIKKWQN